MAIERDVERKLTVGSAQAAKKEQQALNKTKAYIPPKQAPLRVTARPQQNLRDVTTGTIS